MLYHLSDQPDIATFEPRAIDGSPDSVVWAISAARQCNYLLPRDCPRVIYYAGPSTTAADRQCFLSGATAVVADAVAASTLAFSMIRMRNAQRPLAKVD